MTPTVAIPWRRICALRITFPSGTYRGSGFLIGRRTVVTAGHCVFLKQAGGWATSISVYPGADGAKTPFGHAVSHQFRSVIGWVRDAKPEHDYGCIILPFGAFDGKNLGAMGFASWSNSELLNHRATVVGYPGDKPFAEMWGMTGGLKRVTSTQLFYDIDTVGGQSGTCVYMKRNGIRYVVGIHNYGAQSGNSATRITPSIYNRLNAWRQI